MVQAHFDVIIVGGGIAGLAIAAGLYNRGIHNILVLEKARKMQPVGATIGLFPNGFAALQGISQNLHDRVRASSIKHAVSQFNDLDDTLIREKEYEEDKQSTFLVWYLLQQYLAEELGPVATSPIRLGQEVDSFSVEEDTGVVTVRAQSRTNENGSAAESIYSCRVLVGADGIHSKIRRELFPDHKTPLFYRNKHMYRAVIGLERLRAGSCPPAGTSVAFLGEEQGKLFSFRETARGIVTVAAMAVVPETHWSEYEVSMKDKDTVIHPKKQILKDLFLSFPPRVQHVIDQLDPDTIFINPIFDMDVLDEWSRGPVVLIGDASHAMTPGLGQGANQGLEDACELSWELARLFTSDNIDTALIEEKLALFGERRRARVFDIHSASRKRTIKYNQSTKDSTATDMRFGDEELLRQIYDWKPSCFADR